MILYIIRGLQGAGKTTAAKSLNPEIHVEADQFFTINGEYRWNPQQVSEAHEWCQQSVATAMRLNKSPIVVSNTFITRKTMEPYVALAGKYGYSWEIIDLFDAGLTDEELCARCVHQVPLETIRKNRARYER